MSEDFVLNKKRNFNELLNGTGRFVKIELMSFLKTLAPLYLPILFLTMMYKYSFAIQRAGSEPGMSIYVILELLLVLANSLFIMAIYFGFVKEIISGNNPATAIVWKTSMPQIGRIIGLVLLFFLFYIVISIPFTALAYINRKAFVIIPSLVLIVLLLFSIRFSLVLPVMFYEESGLFSSLIRSYKLTRGYWWLTFGGIFIIFIATFVLSLVALIITDVAGNAAIKAVQYDFTVFKIFHAVRISIVLIVGIASQFFLNTFLTLQYFNLVERKEAPDLMARIEDICGTDGQEELSQ